MPEADQDHRPEDVHQVGIPGADPGQPQKSDGGQSQSEHQLIAGPDNCTMREAINAPANVHRPTGRKAKPARARCNRRRSGGTGKEEVGTEDAGADGDGDAVGHRQGAAPEDGQRDQRVLGKAGLGDEEHGQQGKADGQRDDGRAEPQGWTSVLTMP